MSEFIVTRTTYHSGSSVENLQKRSIADLLFIYAARKNYPLLYGMGGMVPYKRKWVKAKGAFRTAEKAVERIDWYDQNMISFTFTGGAAVADTTTTTVPLAAAADYNKCRVGETIRCKNTGEKMLITDKGGSPNLTVRRNLYQRGAATTHTIPAGATFHIVSTAVKEYSSALAERGSTASNNYNNMQIIREDATMSRNEEKQLIEQQGADWHPRGRRKAELMHNFMRKAENALVYGGRGSSTDADGSTVNLMGGINDFILYNRWGPTAGDCTSEFNAGHGGTLSFDEFVSYLRVLSTHYDKGDTVSLMGGSIWDILFYQWGKNYAGAQFRFDVKTDSFGWDIKKIITPFLKVQLIGSGVMEDMEPDAGIFLDPGLIRVIFKEKPNLTEVDMMKTANRTHGTAWTWIAVQTLELLGSKRFGKITGVNGAEL